MTYAIFGNPKLIMSGIFLILVILSTSSTLADEISYEQYCFLGLSYIVEDEQSMELPINSFEEFMNNSELMYFADTPLSTIVSSNAVGKKNVHVRIYRDIIEDSNMLFYYTNVYSDNDDYDFFGCAMVSSNLSIEGVTLDTVTTSVSVLPDGTVPVNLHYLVETIRNERTMSVETLVIDNITFNRFNRYVDRSTFDRLLSWYANLILLIPYAEDVPGKKAWDTFVKFRSTDLVMPIDRVIVESIKENKTTYITISDRGAKDPNPNDINYIFISQIIVALLVILLIAYLLIQMRTGNFGDKKEEMPIDDVLKNDVLKNEVLKNDN